MNLLLKVLQIKAIPIFEGFFKRIYNNKTAVNQCSFGGSRGKHDFKPFFGALGMNFRLNSY